MSLFCKIIALVLFTLFIGEKTSQAFNYPNGIVTKSSRPFCNLEEGAEIKKQTQECNNQDRDNTNGKQVTSDSPALWNRLNSSIYLRFSPLVGGPKFLPIHLEVMLLEQTMCEETSSFSNMCLHRFDFLPLHPNNKATILRILSLQPVPGLVRHKIFVDERVTAEHGDGFLKMFDEKGTTSNVVLVPNERINRLIGNNDVSDKRNGSFAILSNGKDAGFSVTIKIQENADIRFLSCASYDNDLQEIPLQISAKIQLFLEKAKGRQLHLINYNCYSFSWEVLCLLGII